MTDTLPTRHPVDEALDVYTALAAESGEEGLVEDAARQHSIRGHRWFDSLVTMLRVNRIPVTSARRVVQVDKRALTGSLAVQADETPAQRAEHLARLIADDLRLPRSQWTQRILTLAAEYAREEAEPRVAAHRAPDSEDATA